MRSHELAPPLAAGECHVWMVDLDNGNTGEVDACFPLLNAEERERASRLAFADDRRRFIACRALLRRALASYTGTDPHEIRFVLNPWNKPQLSEEFPDLRFNVSHSVGLAYFAFAAGVEVGVDIEYMNPRVNVLELAQDVFSEAEQSALIEMPDDSLTQAFFACWSRKEAYIKARGMGLSMDLRAFDVSIDPSSERWTLAENGGDVSSAWSLYNCSPATNVAGALAIPEPHIAMQRFRWDSSAHLAQPLTDPVMI